MIDTMIIFFVYCSSNRCVCIEISFCTRCL